MTLTVSTLDLISAGMTNKGLQQSGGIRILGFRFMFKFSVCIILLKLWTEGLHLVVMWKYKIWCFQHLALAGAGSRACQCKIFIRSKINQHHKTFILKYVHSQFTSERERRVQHEKLFKQQMYYCAQRKWLYDMTLPLKAINLYTKNGRKTAQEEANRSCCHRGKYDSLNRKFMLSLRWKCLYFCTKSLFNMFWIFADPFRPIWPGLLLV